MQINLLKSIVASVAGSSASGIVDFLHKKKNVNEFLIAKKLKLTINQTRNILYKLADEGLVSFVRKKDNRKGGWYTYFWTLNSGKSLLKFREHLAKAAENLQQQLQQRKASRYFYCPNCDLEFTEENALIHDYTCPECGSVLQAKNMQDEIIRIEKEINKHNSLLEEVDKEVQVIATEETKARNRRARAEVRKKLKSREALRGKKKVKKVSLKKNNKKKNKKR